MSVRITKFIMLFLSQGVNKLVGFLFLPYISRIMSLQDYGSYGQIMLTGRMSTRLFSFGLATVIFVFYAQNENKKVKIFQNNFLGILFVGTTAALMVYLFADQIGIFLSNDSIGPLIRLYAITIPFGMLITSLDSTLIYFNKVKSSAYILVIANLVSIGLMVIALTYYYSIYNLVIAIIIGQVFKFVLLMAYIPKELFNWARVDYSNIKEQLWIGFPLGMTAVLGFVFKYTDSAMVSNMLGTENYAIFRNGAIELPFIAAFYGAITKIVLPDISKMYVKGQFTEIVNLKRKIISYNSLIIFPITVFLILFSGPLIRLYLSEKYAESAGIFAIYTSLLFIRVNNYGDIFTAASKNFQQLIIFSIMIIINIPLNFVLIGSMGKEGAAISTIISFLILVVLLLYKASDILHEKMSSFFNLKIVLSAFGFSLVIGLLFKILYFLFDNPYMLIPTTLLYFISIYSFFYFFRIIPYELFEIIGIKLKLPNKYFVIIKNYYSK